MAVGEVTGASAQELADLRFEYKKSPKFEDTGIPFDVSYCLTRIGKQPEEYEGPTRFCVNRVSRTDDGGHTPSCRFHGGKNGSAKSRENLELLAPLKHGMYATDEHLEEVFDEDDQELYDFIMSWAEAYGWPSKEEDPARYDLLEQIAIERVRVSRTEEYILDEGEMDREEIYDENGNPRTLTNPHGLSEDIRLKRKLILDIMKELGITPKERSKIGAEEKEADAAQQLADVAKEAVIGESDGFDPDNAVFEDG